MPVRHLSCWVYDVVDDLVVQEVFTHTVRRHL